MRKYKVMETERRISVSLPNDLVVRVDKMIGKTRSRSKFIEKVLRDVVEPKKRKKLNTREIDLINANSVLINSQVEETLEFQAEW